ncbi:MAG: hypothetical protein MJ153_01860 [Clostridia bacterium]|nr:hypothetical protein [Clostridia bacterium]
MQGIRRPDTRSNINALATGFVAFVLVFLFEALLNLKYKTMIKIPDDFKELYYGAQLSGQDWSSLYSATDFSVFPALIYAIIFKLVNQRPIFMWQLFLVVMSGVRSLPAFISAYLSKKHFEINSAASVFIGIICSLSLVGRATYLSNSVFLNLFMWLLLLCVFTMISSERSIVRHCMIIVSALLAVLMSLTSIKACTIFIVLVCLFAFEYKNKRMSLREFIISVSAVVISVVLFVIVSYKFEDVFLLPDANPYNVGLTIQNIGLKLTKEYKSFGNLSGWLGFIDTILVSVWELTVYSFGIIPIIILYSFNCASDKRKKNSVLSALGLFISLSLILGILFRALTLSYNYAVMHDKQHSPYKSLFEIGDYACYIGPMLWMFLILRSKKSVSRRKVIITLGSFAAISVYMFFSLFLSTRKLSNYNISSCFADNEAIFLNLASSSDIYGIAVFLLITVLFISLVLFVISRTFNWVDVNIFLVSLFVYQYLYGYFIYDSGFWKTVTNFSYVNVTFQLSKEMGADFNQIDELYYLGDYTGNYITQYALENISVISGVPSEDCDEAVILSSYNVFKIADYIDISDYYYGRKDVEDSNEYLYIKGEDYVDTFSSYGIEFESCAEEYYMYKNLNRIYSMALGRNIDKEGLEYWSEAISEGELTYKEFIYGVLMGEEFERKNYTPKTKANLMMQIFYDLDMTDDEVYIADYDEMKYWCEHLRDGTPFNLIVEEFFQSDKCIIDDLRWK